MNRLRASILATAAAFGLVAVYLVVEIAIQRDTVLVRNALLARTSPALFADWTPANAPREFIVENALPASMTAIAERVVRNAGRSDLHRARAIVAHLLQYTDADRGGSSDRYRASDIYHVIASEGRGYCADYVDSFTGLALAVGIGVRQWGFSPSGYGGNGHVVAEIYDAGRRKWIMLDVHNNVLPVDAAGAPMSVRQFLAAFRADESSVTFERIGAGRLGYVDDAKLRAYYHRGLEHWFLWSGNNVESRSTLGAYGAVMGGVGEMLDEILSIVSTRAPALVPVSVSANQASRDALFGLQKRLTVGLILFGTFGGLLIVQGLAVLVRRRVRTRMARRGPVSTERDANDDERAAAAAIREA